MVAVAPAPKQDTSSSGAADSKTSTASATPAPSTPFKLLSAENSSINTSSGLPKINLTAPPSTGTAPGNAELADRFFGPRDTVPKIPDSTLAKAREASAESLRKIDANPKLSPETKAAARTDPNLRAFLGDEKVPIEMYEAAAKDPAMRRFLLGDNSPVNSYSGPVSGVRVNAPPSTVSQPFLEPNAVSADVRNANGVAHSRGYNAIQSNQRNLLSVDPNKVLESEFNHRVDHAAELKFNDALRKGVPAGEALKAREENEQHGTSAYRMAKKDRQPGDWIGLYDRALSAHDTAAAIDRGAFKNHDLTDKVVLPVRYEDEKHIRETIGRSLRFLNADKDTLSKVSSGDLGYLQSQERKLTLDRLSERTGKSPVEIFAGNKSDVALK